MNDHAAVTGARALQRGIDVLVVGLVAVAVIGAWHGVLAGDDPLGRALVGSVAAAALVCVYTAGAVRFSQGGLATVRSRELWVCLLVALWVVMLAAVPGALWIAFPLMFLELHALPRRAGLVAVAATTALSVAAALATHDQVVGSILGPVLGAGVAIVVVRGFAAVARESAGRQRLIDELEGAREHLAAAERAEAVAVERERLAREIHDTLAQGFSSIELLLRAADDFLGRSDEPAARDLIDRSRDEARRNLEEARRFVRGLAPADLVSGTLVRALERAATRAGGSGGPQVRVVTSGTAGDVPVVVEAALLRVAQSALANALQHADAANVAITVTFLDGGGDAAVALDIVDDGIGFDPDAVASRAGGRRPGFGLVAMRSRVEELGGELAVESTPGLGTAISANVPITLGADAEPDVTPVPVSIDEVQP